jgi:hypothetical protein
MRNLNLTLIFILLTLLTKSQIAVNTTGTAPVASAMLDVGSSRKM